MASGEGGGSTDTFNDVSSGQDGSASDGVNSGKVGGGQDGGVREQGDGLHPNRPHGFAHLQRRQYQSRFEAPSVNDLRARQEATVAKFLVRRKLREALYMQGLGRLFILRRVCWIQPICQAVRMGSGNFVLK